MNLCQEQLKADRNRWKNIMFVHHQINNNSGINIIYKQSSTICIAKLLYTHYDVNSNNAFSRV